MDFLRRLAPLRDTDATRAVAVLPSRFANEGPLRSTASASPGSPRSLDESEFTPAHEAAPRPTPVLARAGAHRDDGGVRPARAEPPHADGVQAKLPHRSFAEAPAIAVATAVATVRASDDRQSVGPQHVLTTSAQRLAATPSAVAELHASPVSPSRDRVSPPLSRAVVAQRAQSSRNDSPVVHVTIGRIDVVAGTPPPAPAARRGPKAPRAPAVSLADYLRAGSPR